LALGGTGLLAAAASLLFWQSSRVAPDHPLSPVSQAERATRRAAHERAPAQRIPHTPPSARAPVATVRLEAPAGAASWLEEDRRVPVAARSAPVGGRGVETGAQSSGAGLVFPDGSRLSLGALTLVSSVSPGTAGAPAGARVLLDRGRVAARWSPARTPRTIVTPLAEVIARPDAAASTSLVVTASATLTRVEVAAGVVELRRFRDGRTALLEAGRFAVLMDEGQFTSLPHPAPVLVVFDNDHQFGSDPVIMERLRLLGLQVRTVRDSELGPEHLQGLALVFITPSSQAPDLDGKLLKTAPIPMVVGEVPLVDDLGMTRSVRHRETAVTATTGFTITAPGHPLAAGLSGALPLLAMPGKVAFFAPGPGAIVVAVAASNADRAAIVAYERGAVMPGGVAPARRVALFLHGGTVPRLNPDGFALLDAAVHWALADRPERAR
jgi:hypothetical protein